MRIALLAIVGLVAAAQGSAQAQPGPYYQPQYNPYYAQTVQRVQYPYGNFGSAPAPATMLPPRTPYGHGPFGYNNGYGVNYYYVQNPLGNYAPPASAGPAPPAAGYPVPVQAMPPLPAAGPDLEPTDGEGASARPGLGFRRPTNECFWFHAGYAATIMRPMHMNGPLVTTGTAGERLPGALGQPSTLALFGDRSVDFGVFTGIRAELGMFIDSENRFSVDVSGLYLFANTQNASFAAGDSGGVLSRPFFNVADGFFQQGRLANSAPGFLTGTIGIDLKSQLSGVELNGRCHAYMQDRYHFEVLGGVRYVRLDENMSVREQVAPVPGSTIPFAGRAFTLPNFLIDEDNFRTANQFLGPQIGARMSWEERWVTLDGFAKIAVGATRQRSEINGTTTLIGPTGSTTVSGGVLALPSNSGMFSRTVLGILPEVGFDLNFNVSQHVRIKAGYSVLMWNRVVRPGSQYDLNLNAGQINSSFFFGAVTGPASPPQRFNDEFYFMHSFNLGLEVHF